MSLGADGIGPPNLLPQGLGFRVYIIIRRRLRLQVNDPTDLETMHSSQPNIINPQVYSMYLYPKNGPFGWVSLAPETANLVARSSASSKRILSCCLSLKALSEKCLPRL